MERIYNTVLAATTDESVCATFAGMKDVARCVWGNREGHRWDTSLDEEEEDGQSLRSENDNEGAEENMRWKMEGRGRREE